VQINFDGQRVLVTGGSRGIGKEIALAFLNAGNCGVVITGKSDKSPEWINEFVGRVEYLPLDLSSDGWINQLEKEIENRDAFDVCVNNAGINSIHLLPEFPAEKVDEILRVNLHAPIVISGIIARKMQTKQYGRIVNISSIFGVVTKSMRSAYTASKSGLIGVTKTMALDLAKDNILVNAVSPGFIDTQLTRDVLGEEGMKEMAARVPMGRLGDVKEIAIQVVFLSSGLNTYMTGQNVIVDGGFVCE